ncbi:hypothetical protein BDV12DRAFT_197738 [Aspergillus spectabilis]
MLGGHLLPAVLFQCKDSFLSYLLAAAAASLSAANILRTAGRLMQRSHLALTASRLTTISPYQ